VATIPAGALLLRYREAWEALRYGRTKFMRELREGRIRKIETPAGPRIKASDLVAYVELLEREGQEREAS
jgi:hypothetical protein